MQFFMFKEVFRFYIRYEQYTWLAIAIKFVILFSVAILIVNIALLLGCCIFLLVAIVSTLARISALGFNWLHQVKAQNYCEKKNTTLGKQFHGPLMLIIVFPNF